MHNGITYGLLVAGMQDCCDWL